MRIAHLMLEYIPLMGGAQVCVDQLARQQLKAGHDVTVITANQKSVGIRQSVPYKLVVLPKGILQVDRMLARGPSRRQLAGLWLKLHAHAKKYDIVHAHMAHSAGVMSTAFSHRAKILVTCHGIDVQQLEPIGYGVSRDPAVSRQLQEVHRKADLITIVGKPMRYDWMRISGNEEPERIVQIPNGSATRRITNLETDRNILRNSLGINDDEVALLCLGRNHPKKNYAASLILAAALKREGFKFKIVLVGEGFETIIEQAKAEEMGDYFITAGPFLRPDNAVPADFPLDAQIRVMKACDVLFLPSLLEGFPLVIPEALASGLAVATTKQAGVEGVFSEEAVVLFDSESSESMVATTRELCNRAKGGAMRALCQAQSELLDWEMIASRYVDTYQELLIGKREG